MQEKSLSSTLFLKLGFNTAMVLLSPVAFGWTEKIFLKVWH